MEHKQNLHTHSTYCDGLNTPEEMVQTALERGFDSLGFSGHSYLFYSDYAGLSMERQDAYVREIRRLQQVYGDRIKLYLGLEVDMYAQGDFSVYDYLIGSVHYLKIGEEYVGFDGNAEKMQRVIDGWFGGDGNAYVKEYFRQLALLPEYGKFDFIGHFDLVSKNIEKANLFDYDSDAYLGWATEAAEALLPHIPFFEVNTGAMSRGIRTTPYPSARITKMLRELGFKPIITTDCHVADRIECGVDVAKECLKEAGFREHFVLTEEGFVGVKL